MVPSDSSVRPDSSPQQVRPAQPNSCTVHAIGARPEPPVTESEANSAGGRFVRPEQPVPPERTSESQIAERTYRDAADLPSIDSRMRVAKALRGLLATFEISVARFALMHDVNEKQAAKWLDGRAPYPAWGFDILPEDMAEMLYAAIRSAKATEGKHALRARIGRLSMPEALDAASLINARIAALAGNR